MSLDVNSLARNLFSTFFAERARAPEQLRTAATDRARSQDADRSKGNTPTVVEAGGQTLQAVRTAQVAPVLALTKFRDGFEQLPTKALVALSVPSIQQQFAAAARIAVQAMPLVAVAKNVFETPEKPQFDLSGSGKPIELASSEPAPEPQPTGFTASLDDLAGLIA